MNLSKEFFNIALLSLLLLIGGASNGFAQEQQPASVDSATPPFYSLEDTENQNTGLEILFYPWNIDELTEDQRKQTISQVRLYNSQIENISARGLVGLSLVQGHLLRNDLEAALIDAYQIQDEGWLAASLVKISRSLRQYKG